MRIRNGKKTKEAKEQSYVGEKAAKAILLNIIEGAVSEAIKIGKCTVTVEVPKRLEHIRGQIIEYLHEHGYGVKEIFSNQNLAFNLNITW